MKRKGKRTLTVQSCKKDRPRNLKVSREDSLDGEYEGLEDPSPYEINQELTRRKAKELYILYGWNKAQLMTLGIPEKTLDMWLYNPTQGRLSWKAEKDVFESTVFNLMKDHKAEELKDVQGTVIGMIKQGLLHLGETGEIMSVAQIEKLTNVLGKLDHMLILTEGKPTSIRADVNLTQQDIDRLITELQTLDPFIDYSSKGRIN